MPGSPGREHERHEREPGRQRRHQHRHEPLERAPDDHVLGERLALVLDEVQVVRDHHDAVAARDAGERDEPDERRDRERLRREPQRHDAADERERDVEHHLRDDPERSGSGRTARGSSRRARTARGSRSAASPPAGSRTARRTRRSSPAGISTSAATRALRLLDRRRRGRAPATLALTTIRRCTFSRATWFGPGALDDARDATRAGTCPPPASARARPRARPGRARAPSG